MTVWETLPTSGAALAGGHDGWVTGEGGVRLHFVERGAGPLVVLLHGFPEFWYAWRRQLPALAAAGFRAVALDLRGYNLSERPPHVEAYAVDRLAADVASAVAQLGGPAHAIVGHDWGGVIAWRLAAVDPTVTARLAILNAPHPRRFRELLRTPAQLRASWYAAAFQLPLLPEVALRRANREPLLGVLRAEHARAGALTDDDLDAYRRAFADPASVSAALAYYRAAARGFRRAASGPHVVRRPTLVIWGMRDRALVPANVEGLDRWVPDLRVARVPWARHFVQWDAPDEVNAALLRFLEA